MWLINFSYYLSFFHLNSCHIKRTVSVISSDPPRNVRFTMVIRTALSGQVWVESRVCSEQNVLQKFCSYFANFRENELSEKSAKNTFAKILHFAKFFFAKTIGVEVIFCLFWWIFEKNLNFEFSHFLFHENVTFFWETDWSKISRKKAQILHFFGSERNAKNAKIFAKRFFLFAANLIVGYQYLWFWKLIILN